MQTLFGQDDYCITVVQKTGQRKGECEDGKHSGNDHDGADGTVRRGKGDVIWHCQNKQGQ